MKLLFGIISFLFSSLAYSQDTTKIIIQKGVPICKDTTNILLTRVWLPKAVAIYIVDYKSQNKYYPFKYQDATYYVYNQYLQSGLPTAAKSSPTSIIDHYIEMYGRPDDTSDYSSGDYKSKTYTWYCAAGKYRSIDFEFKNNKWVVGSEHSSECIR